MLFVFGFVFALGLGVGVGGCFGKERFGVEGGFENFFGE